MALGADRLQVTGMILRQSFALMIAGIAIGIAGSFWASQLLANFLYGVSTRDPWMMFAGPTILLLSGTVAALIPARSAASIDPMRALRNDT
jgi:ABC-type antimicrobial peptide transport system permease subunit